MSQLLYYLVLKPVSLLPLMVSYFLSDIMYLIVYRIVGYRTAVVRNNLSNAFPQKSANEIKVIERKFYRHLCDVIIESIHLFSISREELSNRFRIKNPELLEQLYKDGKSVILVGAHYNNWEVAGMGFDLDSPHTAIGIYTPLSNKFFDKVFAKSRTKFGVNILPIGMVPRSFIKNRDKLTMTIFGADQSPTFANTVHWMNFLNQETAVHLGTEIFAKKYNYPVLFFHLKQVRRGYYEGHYEVLHNHPAKTENGEITRLHTRHLEKIIEENPQYWLWSHKRWKRKKTDEEREAELNIIQQAS